MFLHTITDSNKCQNRDSTAQHDLCCIICFECFDPWPYRSIGSRHLTNWWYSCEDHPLNSSQSGFWYDRPFFAQGGQLFDRLVSLGRYKAQSCCVFWVFHWESTAHGGCVGCSTFQLLSSQEAKAACVVQEILEVQRVTDAFWRSSYGSLKLRLTEDALCGEWTQLFEFPRSLLLDTLWSVVPDFSLCTVSPSMLSLYCKTSLRMSTRFQVYSAAKLCSFCPYNPYSCTECCCSFQLSSLSHFRNCSTPWIWWLCCIWSFRQWPTCTGKASCIEQKAEFLRSGKSSKGRTWACKDFQWFSEC